jgi:hypothetical protein
VRTLAERHASAVTRRAYADKTVTVGQVTVDRTRSLISQSRALLDRLHPAFGGGDTPPDEATIRRRVRVLIDFGILPRSSSGQLIVVPCRVERQCEACGGWIRAGEDEVEIAPRLGLSIIHLHRPCLDLWSEEASDGHEPCRLQGTKSVVAPKVYSEGASVRVPAG